MMGWYGGWGGGWIAMVLMTIFWVALVGGVVWAAVQLTGHRSSPTGGAAAAPTPRAILDHRLATGEIDAEQYAQLRRVLEGRSAGAGTSDPGEQR